MQRVFRSFKVRNFRLFITGQIVKLVGVWMLFVTQDWLVLELSGDSATALGLVTALQFAPVLLLTLYGGKLADRYDKRHVIMLANVFFAACSLSLGLLVAFGAVRLWHVFLFAALIGCVSAIENPTRQAFWSELVGPELMPNALSLGSATFNLARLVGPAVAGVLIASLGSGTVVLITAAMAVVAVVLQLRLRADELYRDFDRAPAKADTSIKGGLRYVQRRPDLMLIMALVLVIGMLGFNFQLTLAVLAKTVFRTGAEAFGVLTSALACGALGGALASTVRRGRPTVYVVLAAATAFATLETLLGLAPTFWLAITLALPTGFFMIYFMQAANQRIQLGVDPLFRGRVMALHVLVFFGTTPLGAPLVGWVSEEFGPRVGIWSGGLGSLVAALAIALIQVRRSKARVRVHLRPSPHVHLAEPASAEGPALELRVPTLR
ncbi:MFS transporter [Virgisporangium aliadipatigenens]|uniref:MFS transporter n=1 Tax=Virgisporangium aliadipatigenens TaxID=741659 RepID=A0A8J3YHQ9_9ACTN|nr:MFS transporter [Virgisporangium aliadipatigenens]GIJ44433.1 MFS transporter [Virgisporangium aliadipatigenens]